MSHSRVKVKYEEEGPHASTTDETLYCDHNHTADVVTFYDGDGNHLLSINEFSSNNLWTAMEKLMYYHRYLEQGIGKFNDASQIEYWDSEDREKIKK